MDPHDVVHKEEGETVSGDVSGRKNTLRCVGSRYRRCSQLNLTPHSDCSLNAHSSLVVCSHLFVSIHLREFMITNHIFASYTASLHVQLQPGPERASHNSARAATQTATSSPAFFRNCFCRSSCFHGLQETREKQGLRNRWRQAVERESESRVEAHRRRKKPDLLSPPKNQLQMSARRFSLCPQLWRLTQRSAQPPSFLPYAHIYKHAD